MSKTNQPSSTTFSTKPFTKAPDFQDPAIAELLQMHTFCRPHDGATVKQFCKKYIDNLPGMKTDKVGNRILRIGNAPVLWSSHTDTVHKQDGKQRLTYAAGMLYLADKSPSNCLGADCTVGVWLMRQMILRQIPGLYIFHHAEEVGGIGSDYIATKTPHLLNGIDYAIAFDRKGTGSVITHQFRRCASDTFGNALAAQLGPNFTIDDGGTFTDTANYMGLVPECTNISVGYYSQHTAAEVQDVGFAAHLLNKLCALDTSSLPVDRDPSNDSDFGARDFCASYYTEGLNRTPNLYDLVFEQPKVATKILKDLGISADDFAYYVWEADHVRQ